MISEFGNINELIDELGLKTENNKLVVDKDEIKAYQLTKKKKWVVYCFWCYVMFDGGHFSFTFNSVS